MTGNYGFDRVLEPEGTVPVSAWKIDNDPTLRKGEVRLKLERIHIDRDSFHQICSSCAFDEERIRAKIRYIIQRRGKLHNPSTNSGGNLCGVIDEVGPGVVLPEGLTIGSKVYYTPSLVGIPIQIEHIESIDYNYGQILCNGHAIISRMTELVPVDPQLQDNYTLAALNEEGDLFKVSQLINSREVKRCMIIGKDIHTVMLYSSAIRKEAGSGCRITAVMNKSSRDRVSESDTRKVLDSLVDYQYFLDVTTPHAAFGHLLKREFKHGFMDMVIVTDTTYGSETLAALSARSKGLLFFNTIRNNAGNAGLVAEGLGKKVSIDSAADHSVENYAGYTMNLVRWSKEVLEVMDRFFGEHAGSNGLMGRDLSEKELTSAAGIQDYVFDSDVTRAMLRNVINVANFDCNVIIQGETGVGKEKILSLIHENSARRDGPCIRINCSTIAPDLAESEFFGYDSGAFTGASSGGKKGFFELANHGTLFLDEVGTLPLSMQSKLLRVLQENQFYHVGGTRQIDVDVRVICASNIPLKQMVEEGKFREDLYYRLNICTINVPPLRERKGDITRLAQHFVEYWNQQYHISKSILSDAFTSLAMYSWPGNVRELENVMHRLVINSKGSMISGGDVDEILNAEEYNDMVAKVKAQRLSRGQGAINYYEVMDEQERNLIEYALAEGGTVRKAAELIGLSHSTFARKKQKYGL